MENIEKNGIGNRINVDEVLDVNAKLSRDNENLRAKNHKLLELIYSHGIEVPPDLTTPSQEAQDFLETATIENLDILTHTYNVIVKGRPKLEYRGNYSLQGIRTVKELTSHRLSELYILDGFGHKAALDLICALKKRGLAMAEETDGKYRRLVDNLNKLT